VKNFLALTLLAIGTPMLLMAMRSGAASRAITIPIVRIMRLAGWIGAGLKKYPDVHRFVRQLIAIRLQPDPYQGYPERPTLNQIFARLEIKFHGVRLNQQGWGDEDHSWRSASGTLRAVCFATLSSMLIGNLWNLSFRASRKVNTELVSAGWILILGLPDDISPWAEA